MNVSHEWKIPEGATVHIKEVLCPICHLLINDNPIMMFLENGGVVRHTSPASQTKKP